MAKYDNILKKLRQEDKWMSDWSLISHNTLQNKDVAWNHAKLIPLADWTTAIQITKADWTTVIFNVDSTNWEIQIWDFVLWDLFNIDRFWHFFNTWDWITFRDEYVAWVWELWTWSAAPDNVSVIIGWVPIKILWFDWSTTTEDISNSFEMAHDICYTQLNNDTQNLEFHIHMIPSTNNAWNVRFVVTMCYIPVNEAPVVLVDWVTWWFINNNIPLNSQYKHFISWFEITRPVWLTYNLWDIILFNIKRIPTNAGDTYPNDILFVKSALHVPVDMTGSRERYTK